MIDQLPAEVILLVFGFLRLPALAACQRVSSAWLALIADHSNCLYRDVLALEGLTPARRTAGSAEGDRVNDWREACRQAKVLSTNWRHCRATSGWLVNPSRDVWRIKLDEDSQSVIMSARGGGLSIVDLQTNRPIQRIAEVRPYAHVEFDRGYLVVDNPDGHSHTVYRLRADVARVDGIESNDDDPRSFAVWGTLDSPGPIRAYRLVFPHLLVGGMNTRNAWLWDVRTCSLLATIALSPTNTQSIMYVELTLSHVLIVDSEFLSYYRRPTEASADPTEPLTGQLVYRFPARVPVAALRLPLVHAQQPGEQTPPERMRRANVGFTSDGYEVVSFGLGLAAGDGLKARVWTLPAEKDSKGWPQPPSGRLDLNAVHSCGKHLFLISRQNYVFILLEHERVFADPRSLQDSHTLVLDLGHPAFNLCSSERGAVITTRSRVLYIAYDDLPTVDALEHYQKEGEPLSLTVHQLLDVTETAAEVISSVQMDSERIALTYYVKADDVDETRPGAPPYQTLRGGQTAVKLFDFGPTDLVPVKALALVEERLGRTEHGES